MLQIYAVICHRFTNPLLFTVTQLLQSKNTQIILHIDQKTSDQDVEKIKKALGQHQNLYYVPDDVRVDIKWGEVSQIHLILRLLELAQHYTFQYFHLISGDDVLLSSNQNRESFLAEAAKNQIEFIGIDHAPDIVERVKYKYPEFFYQREIGLWPKVKRKVFYILAPYLFQQDISHLPTLYKGSNWFSLTQTSTRYILTYLENNPDYLPSFTRSFCADEVFFHSILINNAEIRARLNGINDQLADCAMGSRYIDWQTGPDFPRTLDDQDVEQMRQSNCMFARKLHPDASFEFLAQFIVPEKMLKKAE